MRNILVIGDGAWGTAIAILLANKGLDVTLWSAFANYAKFLDIDRENRKFLPGVQIPFSVEITPIEEVACRNAQCAVVAVPTLYMRSVLERFKQAFDVNVPVVSLAKGIENETLMRPSQIIQDVLGDVKVAVLSGPSHAEEVARFLPTTVVTSSKYQNLTQKIQKLFSTKRFRVYTNQDMLGVELAGALKNIIGIAAGICEGLGFGDNSKSALLSRGIVEMARLGVAMGAKRETFYGLAGIGDLITTCISPYGRNRAVGVAIGKGRKLQEILSSMNAVAEGVRTTKSVKEMAQDMSIEMPITQETYNILFEDKDPVQAVQDLMVRELKEEDI